MKVADSLLKLAASHDAGYYETFSLREYDKEQFRSLAWEKS